MTEIPIWLPVLTSITAAFLIPGIVGFAKIWNDVQILKKGMADSTTNKDIEKLEHKVDALAISLAKVEGKLDYMMPQLMKERVIESKQ